uniref:Uncharacterized protein MANES_14G133700 n=1 Tax=Rhizophora mucronata TaxID=61149 RepID=A0A2P2LHN9_RHIMU
MRVSLSTFLLLAAGRRSSCPR